MSQQTVARNDFSRAFIFKNGIDVCVPTYQYFPCLGVDALSQDFGDITRIECPDPYNYGRYIEVAQVPGEIGRMTTTLTTRLSRTELSLFRNFAVRGCGFDLHLHFGLCQKPNDFNAFDKMMIFEDVFVTSYGTDALSALQSSDRETITETIDISVGNYYEVVPLMYAQREITLAASLEPIIDMVYADNSNCGVECDTPSDGCQDVFAITADGIVLWSRDGGKTYTLGANDWDSTTTGPGNAGIGYLNNFVFTYVNDANASVVFATKADALADEAPTVVGNFTANPNLYVYRDLGVGAGVAIVVGDDGFMAVTGNPTRGFDEVYDGTFTAADLVKVQFRPGSDTALIVGATGTVISYIDGEFEPMLTTGSALAALSLTAALPVSDKKFLVGNTVGNIYCSTEPTVPSSWTMIRHPLSGTNNAVTDIQMVSKHILAATFDNGEILISYDGGGTWNRHSSVAAKSNHIVTAVINDILVCGDVNKINFGGENATAGYFLQASAV